MRLKKRVIPNISDYEGRKLIFRYVFCENYFCLPTAQNIATFPFAQASINNDAKTTADGRLEAAIFVIFFSFDVIA